jgi:hypothetical protein
MLEWLRRPANATGLLRHGTSYPPPSILRKKSAVAS